MIDRKGGVSRFSSAGGTYQYSGYSGYPLPGQQNKTSAYTHRSSIATVSKSTQNVPTFRRGDMVQHTAFGRGMVLSVMKMGGDALLEIAFDGVGTKKLMAKTASAHMKKL